MTVFSLLLLINFLMQTSILKKNKTINQLAAQIVQGRHKAKDRQDRCLTLILQIKPGVAIYRGLGHLHRTGGACAAPVAPL